MRHRFHSHLECPGQALPVVSVLVSFARVQHGTPTAVRRRRPWPQTVTDSGGRISADLGKRAGQPSASSNLESTDCHPGPHAAQSDACELSEQRSGLVYAQYVPKGTTGTARCQRLCSSAANQTRPARLFTRRLLHLSFYMPIAELRRVIEAAPCAAPWRVSLLRRQPTLRSMP